MSTSSVASRKMRRSRELGRAILEALESRVLLAGNILTYTGLAANPLNFNDPMNYALPGGAPPAAGPGNADTVIFNIAPGGPMTLEGNTTVSELDIDADVTIELYDGTHVDDFDVGTLKVGDVNVAHLTVQCSSPVGAARAKFIAGNMTVASGNDGTLEFDGKVNARADTFIDVVPANGKDGALIIGEDARLRARGDGGSISTFGSAGENSTSIEVDQGDVGVFGGFLMTADLSVVGNTAIGGSTSFTVEGSQVHPLAFDVPPGVWQTAGATTIGPAVSLDIEGAIFSTGGAVLEGDFFSGDPFGIFASAPMVSPGDYLGFSDGALGPNPYSSDPFGTLTVNGSATFADGMVLCSVWGNSTTGVESNLFVATGDVALAGPVSELQVTETSALTIPSGAAFTVLQSASLSGNFDDLPFTLQTDGTSTTTTFSGSEIGLTSATTWELKWVPGSGGPGSLELVNETAFTGTQFVWDGAATTSDWTNATNWYPVGYPEWYHPRAPGAGDEAIFDGNIASSASPALPANESVASMEIENSANVSLNASGHTLAIAGLLSIDNGYSPDNAELSVLSSTSGGTLQASSISVAGALGETGDLYVSGPGVSLVDTGNLLLGDAGGTNAIFAVNDSATATVDGDMILGGAPAYGGPAGEGQVFVDGATLSVGEVDTNGEAAAYVQDNGTVYVSGNLNFGDSSGTTTDASLFDDEFPGSVTVGGTVNFVNAVLTGDGSFWGSAAGGASMATGYSSTMGSPTAEFDPGSDYGGPVSYIDVDGNVDVSQGFAFDVTLSPGDAEAYRNDSNPIVASGTVTIGGDIAYGGVLSAITGSTLLDDGSLATGQDYPLFVASDFVSSGYGSYGDEFGAFGDYDPNVGGPLPPTFTAGLPAPPDGDCWALTYVPATINSDGTYSVGSGSQVALALELDVAFDYGGMGMMRMGGAGLSVGMGDGAGAGESDAPALAPPDSLAAAAITGIGIQLQWTDTTGSADSPTDYEIQRQTDGGSWLTIRITPAVLNQWVDTTVSAGHTYDYRIRALSSDGTLDSDFTELPDPITV